MEKRLSIWWDKEGDFLEFTVGKPRKGFFKELGNDILERVDAKTGKTIGFAIMNFSKAFKKPKEKEIILPVGMELKSIREK